MERINVNDKEYEFVSHPKPDEQYEGVYFQYQWYVPIKEKPKDYEIMSFEYLGTVIPLLQDWKKYPCYTQPTYVTEGQQLSLSFALKNASIWQVKRSSDGEVFTVGDVVGFGSSNPPIKYTIDHFFIRGDGKLLARDKSMAVGEYVDDNLFKQQKNILFTTADGKDIREGEEFWYVDNELSCIEIHKAQSSIVPFGKAFSTDERAKEFVLFNKPLLSLNDIIDCYLIGSMLSEEQVKSFLLFSKFKNTAQNKLNEK